MPGLLDPRPRAKKGVCLWCGHSPIWHNGYVRDEVKNKPEFKDVKWSSSACSQYQCKGCRTYET